MDYPMQVWYGVYFSGKTADQPSLPDWTRDLLEAEDGLGLAGELGRRGYQGDHLVWVACEEFYGLAVAESVLTIRSGVLGVLAKYPDEPADWALRVARVLAFLGTAAGANITWYAGAGVVL